MNLYAAVAGVTAAVNPSTLVTIRPSTGVASTTPAGKRIPAYGEPVQIWADVQALTSGELRHLDGLNIQGAQYSVYLVGRWAGAIRAVGQGGDLMEFSGQTWLVVAIMERWSDFTKVAVMLQNDGAR